MRGTYLLFILFVLSACNNEPDQVSILHQPPYNSISDSIQQNPQNAELYYRRGVLLYQEGEKKLAEADIRKAWELQPTENYGLSLTTILKEKHADSAIVFLQQAIEKVPESIALHIGLARGYQQKDRNEEAIAIVDKILEQFPGQIDALTIKSEILGSENKTGESITYLERAYSLVPSDFSLAYDLAYEYAMAKNVKVIAHTDSLIKNRTPEIEKAYFTRGLYFANSGKALQALENYDASIKNNYNFADAWLEKGILLFNQKRFEEAQVNFERALKVAPANAMFYYWLGKCQEARGFKSEAKLNYHKAFGLDKELTEAKQAAEKL